MSPIRAALVLGCAYEIVALVSNRIPTITALIRQLAQHRAGKALVWAWVGFVAHHFLTEVES